MRLIRALLAKSGDVGELTKQFSNLPESYIKRSMEQVYWKTPRGKPFQYLPRTVQRKTFRFGTHRPWTAEFRQQNAPGKYNSKIFLEPIKDWQVFRGDRVKILAGPDKGKQGIVKLVIQERNWVFVDGLNTHLRIVAKSKDFPGVTIRQEAPLLVTDQIALVDPSDLEETKVEWRFTEEGERVRVSVRTGRIIPIPKMSEETYDYKNKATYKEKEKDTPGDVVTEISFKPSLATFEMEIMKVMGIEEERIPAKTYWY